MVPAGRRGRDAGAPPCRPGGSARSTDSARRAEERVAPGHAVDRGLLEQLPAVEDRLGVDERRAAARRPGPEEQVRGLAVGLAADAAEHGARDDAGPLAQRADDDVLAAQPELLEEVAAD